MESNIYYGIKWVEDTLIRDGTFSLLGRKAPLKSDMEYEMILVDIKNGDIISLAFANGKKHDFQLFKDSCFYPRVKISQEADTGHQGHAQMHANSLLP